MPNSVLIAGNFISAHTGTRGPCEGLSDQLEGRGWRVIRAGVGGSRGSRVGHMLKTAWQKRRDYPSAVVEVYSGWAFGWALLICGLLRLLQKPYLLSLQGGNLPIFAGRWGWLVRWLLRSTSLVTTPSHYIARHFQDFELIILPNGIDLSAYQFKPRPAPAPDLVWLRAFHQIYDPALAAEVIGRLAAEFPEMTLTMYGPDKADGSREACLAAAQQWGITDRIAIPGAIPKAEVPQKLAQHAIFLNTTTAESFGVAVAEAAALGLCIVTTDAGELGYSWVHEQDALLVPVGDGVAMAAAVRRLLVEPDLAGRLAANAARKVQQYDWGVVLPRWETLIRQQRQ